MHETYLTCGQDQILNGVFNKFEKQCIKNMSLHKLLISRNVLDNFNLIRRQCVRDANQ